MTTRREVAQRKMELLVRLRQAILCHQLVPGSMLPSLRELAEEHHLSVQVVRQCMQELLAEGIIYTVPYVGTFVGTPPVSASEIYLLTLGRQPQLFGDHFVQLQFGFEEQIAQLGGTSLVMTRDRVLVLQAKGHLPPLAGVFAFAESRNEITTWKYDRNVPLANFIGCLDDPAHADVVAFDDVDAGRQATQHLIGLGYRQIAYAAVHLHDDMTSLPWSVERELGWREAMDSIGLPCDALELHPQAALTIAEDHHDLVNYANYLVRELAYRPTITAVIAANDTLAMYMIDALRGSSLPAPQWPAIVGFDNLPIACAYNLTSVRLPWEDLGREAAQLLWQRHHGKLTGAPQLQRIRTTLLPRLTSHQNWSLLDQQLFAGNPA